MSKGRQIFPECYGDTTLIEVLGFQKPDHQRSITSVLDMLNDPKLSFKTLVGVIDDDKKKPGIFKEYAQQEEIPSLVKMKHPDRNHYLIVLKPALEKFLLDAAHDAHVDPSKYGFREMDDLKKACKSLKASQNQDLKQFINSIKQKKEDSAVKTLKNWLEEILGEEI